MTGISQKRSFRTEKRPPEGGWGFLIGVGVAIPIACITGSLSSFGLMFNDFITSCGSGTSAVTIINGVFFSSISFSGLFASSLFKKYSMRSVGIFGASIYILGSLMTIFVISVDQLIVSFGVLQGFGFGMMVPVYFTTFNRYFVQKRVFMMSLAQTLTGICTMSYPLVVDFLFNKYGFRGMMAVIAAMNAHVMFAMIAMHPVEWHYKVVEIPIEDAKPLMDANDNENEKGKEKEKEEEEKGKEEKSEAMSGDEFDESELNHLPPHAKKKPRFSVPNGESINSNTKYERSKSLIPGQELDGFNPVQRRVSSIMSLGQFGAAIYSQESLESVKNGKWQKVVDFLDLNLLKDFVYMNIVFGLSFALYSDASFFTLQPMYLFELGFSKSDTAKIVAVGAAADMFSRMSLAVISFFIAFKARHVYLAGAVGTITFRFVFLNIHNYIGMIIITAILGYLRTLMHTPLALVFGEYLPQERFASGYSLFMLFQGNFAFLVGPVIGWIRDVTKDYIICFHSLTFILALCAIPWIIEIIWLRIYRRKDNAISNFLRTEMSQSDEKQKFRIEKIAPDGGWGYVIGIGIALPFACSLGSLSSFGLMFNDFITSCNGGTSSVTIIMGIFFCSLSFAGLFVSTLSRKFSLRNIGVFGGTIYFVGGLMVVFATSVEHLLIAFGVFQGLGVGFIISIGYSTFNQYFVIRRASMMGAAQFLVGIGTMLYPMFVQYLMETYGFRGAMAVIAACNAHAIFGMLVMHPIEWHHKTIKVPVEKEEEEEEERLMISTEKQSAVKITVILKEDEKQTIDPENLNRFSVPDLVENMKQNDAIILKNKRSKSLDPNGFNDLKSRISSIMSLNEMSGDIIMNNDRAQNGKWKKVVDFLDLTLLKDLVYVNIVLGTTFALYSDNSFFTLEPMYLFELGFSKADTAKIISAGAAADLSSRLFLAVTSFFIQVKARYVYLAGAIATIFVRFVFLTVSDFYGMVIVTAAMGFFRTFVHVPLALVYGEYLPQERFPSGYGLFMCVSGNIAFLISPFIGWIRDVTKSYVICFHSLTLLMALCAVPWLIEIIWLKLHPRKTEK
ncbi:uncharacterized protein LOC129567563 [Sitodiplosis mosellana]|uniref:uncharacterized protein LOC129567563 n=1 Tax=Sitodiplosis mosellana TaxID=263140 RepID=UPI00244445E2|nr:uncharacterized protein LOC129567563 [Sitodiplosis mosellana]